MFKIVVQRKPCLALVAVRDDYLGHAVERSLNPLHGDWLKLGRMMSVVEVSPTVEDAK